MSAVRKRHSSGDKRWPHVPQRASSWITLILDIWVAASWLFTRRWCNALTVWVQSDLRLFHSGHFFFFFLCSHGHGMFSGWFKENPFSNSPQMCFFLCHLPLQCGNFKLNIFSHSVIQSQLEDAALLMFGSLFTAEANCCSCLQLWGIFLKANRNKTNTTLWNTSEGWQ